MWDKGFLRIAAILVFTNCVQAQMAKGVRSPEAEKPQVRGSVHGHVLLADVHAPARGARVMLLPLSSLVPGKESEPNTNEQSRLGVTALDGSFTIPQVGLGEYLVVALAVGYLSPLEGLTVTEKLDKSDSAALEQQLRRVGPVIRVEGAGEVPVELELQRGAILSGRVLYADGSPASQLAVAVQKVGEPEDAQAPQDRFDVGTVLIAMVLKQSLSTDDQGHFRIAGLGPGGYRLAVMQSFESTSLNEEVMGSITPGMIKQGGKLTIYSGNTLHRKDAKVFDLRAGDRVDDIEIILPLTGLHTVRGIAAGKDGLPLNYGNLDLTDTADKTIAFHTRIHENGEFHFNGVPEGSYELKASNGRVFQTAPSWTTTDSDLKYVAASLKPLRAFADTTTGVAVQHSDLEGLTVTLPDMKIPESELKPNVPAVDDPDQ